MCQRFFTKYAWVKSLEGRKAKTVLNGFIEIVTESNRNPNKLWVDKEKKITIALCQSC